MTLPPSARPVPDLPTLLTQAGSLVRDEGIWILGYASLIWRPEFESVQAHAVTVHGWHRALRMRSTLWRGTPERPGLVCALMRGGTCRAMVYRLSATQWADALTQLWAREMPQDVYQPRWLRCRCADGPERRALAFTLAHDHPAHVRGLCEAELHRRLQACGRAGSTAEYLRRTAEALRQHGLRDRGIERLHALLLKRSGGPDGPG
ncbi:MAG: hypothetical protein RL223_4176 [Pseudomonadota bacterium]|jgi:cation transport protein ChaC